MAQRTITKTLCDRPHIGTRGEQKGIQQEVEATNSHTMILDGKPYRFDQCDAHEKEFNEAIAPYLEFAFNPPRQPRIVGGTGGRRRTASGEAGVAAGVIRAWAKENGHEVSERGRVPSELIEAYKAAQAA